MKRAATKMIIITLVNLNIFEMNKYFLIILMISTLSACQQAEEGEPNQEMMRLEAINDSLQKINDSRDTTINAFIGAMNLIEENLVEIKAKENILASAKKELMRYTN